MKLKTLSVLLVLLAVASATAPTWIAPGVSLNYTSGTTSVSFAVTSATSGKIGISLTTSPPPNTNNFEENATLTSGQFWFDPNMISHAYQGELINGFTVTSTGPQSFAGQSWNTATLRGIVSGAETSYTYDEQTGLLLEQTVEASGVPNVVLSQYYIPALAPPPQNITPPPQNTTVPPAPQPNATIAPPPVPPAVNTTAQGNSTDNSSAVQPTDNSSLVPSGAGDQGSTSSDQSSSSSLPCCPTSFILLLAGFVAIKAAR